MELKDFKIRQLIFEIRYENAYQLWDCAGVTTQELIEIWPGSTLNDGQPNQQSIKSDKTSLTTGINTSQIVINYPKTIIEYSNQIEETLKVWVKHLKITNFTRVGTRVIYSKNFSDTKLADKAIVDMGLIKYPNLPFFNFTTLPSVSDLRLYWEEENSQTQILLKSEHQQIEVSGFDEQEERQINSKHYAILDIDRATKGTIELSKFKAHEWLDGVKHIISRDIDKFLNTS
jgi:hypothetical protein